MKRSRINQLIAEGAETIARHGFVLPPFARWSPDGLAARADEARHVVDARCGWDVADGGAGRHREMGPFPFALHNGFPSDLGRGGGMCYAEALSIPRQEQLSPMHTHRPKAEDTVFRDPIGRISEIDEDAPPTHLLVGDDAARLAR